MMTRTSSMGRKLTWTQFLSWSQASGDVFSRVSGGYVYVQRNGMETRVGTGVGTWTLTQTGTRAFAGVNTRRYCDNVVVE